MRIIMTSDLSNKPLSGWALILGLGPQGFGGATALELARRGMNIFGVHLDRRNTLPDVEALAEEIRAMGRECILFNINAADEKKRAATLNEIADRLSKEPEGEQRIKLMLHALAFGTLKPYFADTVEERMTAKSMAMTIDVMANSLVYWAQGLWEHKLLKKGSHIMGMTSAGGRVMWPSYGAVSAAKAAMESHLRQIAVELGQFGIASNSIEAGVTDTPALRKIPGSEKMVEDAIRVNPSNRLTTPQDIGCAIADIIGSEATWMTGNVIRVDGGEGIVG